MFKNIKYYHIIKINEGDLVFRYLAIIFIDLLEFPEMMFQPLKSQPLTLKFSQV